MFKNILRKINRKEAKVSKEYEQKITYTYERDECIRMDKQLDGYPERARFTSKPKSRAANILDL